LKEEYVKWYSPHLGKDTEMLVFGHSGYPIIIFPTSMGRYYQNKDFKLVDSVRWYVEQGLIKIYCPDSIDADSWYNKNIHPSERVRNHAHYDLMILEEVVSRARNETNSPKVAMAGCSFGAYHATTFAFRYPELVGYLFNMGGAFDIRMQLNGYYDDNVYYYNPVDFITNLYHPALFAMGMVFGVGEYDFCRRYNEHMSDLLHAKGIQHWLDIRLGGGHDWPVWRDMFPH
jgi:esterase/lipase superfamily enzyme